MYTDPIPNLNLGMAAKSSVSFDSPTRESASSTRESARSASEAFKSKKSQGSHVNLGRIAKDTARKLVSAITLGLLQRRVIPDQKHKGLSTSQYSITLDSISTELVGSNSVPESARLRISEQAGVILSSASLGSEVHLSRSTFCTPFKKAEKKTEQPIAEKNSTYFKNIELNPTTILCVDADFLCCHNDIKRQEKAVQKFRKFPDIDILISQKPNGYRVYTRHPHNPEVVILREVSLTENLEAVVNSLKEKTLDSRKWSLSTLSFAPERNRIWDLINKSNVASIQFLWEQFETLSEKRIHECFQTMGYDASNVTKEVLSEKLGEKLTPFCYDHDQYMLFRDLLENFETLSEAWIQKYSKAHKPKATLLFRKKQELIEQLEEKYLKNPQSPVTDEQRLLVESLLANFEQMGKECFQAEDAKTLKTELVKKLFSIDGNHHQYMLLAHLSWHLKKPIEENQVLIEENQALIKENRAESQDLIKKNQALIEQNQALIEHTQALVLVPLAFASHSCLNGVMETAELALRSIAGLYHQSSELSLDDYLKDWQFDYNNSLVERAIAHVIDKSEFFKDTSELRYRLVKMLDEEKGICTSSLEFVKIAEDSGMNMAQVLEAYNKFLSFYTAQDFVQYCIDRIETLEEEKYQILGQISKFFRECQLNGIAFNEDFIIYDEHGIVTTLSKEGMYFLLDQMGKIILNDSRSSCEKSTLIVQESVVHESAKSKSYIVHSSNYEAPESKNIVHPLV